MHAYKIIYYTGSSNAGEGVHKVPARMNNHILSHYISRPCQNTTFQFLKNGDVTKNARVAEGGFYFETFEKRSEIVNSILNDVLHEVENYKIYYHECYSSKCSIDTPCDEWEVIEERGRLPQSLIQ